MRTIGSVEFRSIFPTLVEPVSIVARGRPVGVFYPAGTESTRVPQPVPAAVPQPEPKTRADAAPAVAPASRAPTPREQQAIRDGWLRASNSR
jgi:hypothetical protein